MVYRLFLLIFFVAPLTGAWKLGSASGPYIPAPIVVCNIVTGVATGVGAGTCATTTATCNGSADDAAAFGSFNAWALSQQTSHPGTIELFIPSGSTCEFLSNTGNGLNFTAGIKALLISGYGATMSDNGGGSFFNLGVSGICQTGLTQAGGCSARTASASMGATSVTLLDTSLCSRFTVGRWADMTGFDVQGLWQAPYGFPPNQYYHDYVKVTDTSSCASSGTISFDRPLTRKYESTWPNFNSGDAFEADAGGPATLYALSAVWDADVEVDGVTIDQANWQTPSVVRNIIFNNVTVGGSCILPSQNLTWTIINSTINCKIEVDKMITTVTISGSTISEIDVQSSSPDVMTMTNTTIYTVMEGTPRKFVGTNVSTPEMRVGSLCCGRTDEFDCTNCVLQSFNIKGPTDLIQSSWSMSGGVITIPNTQFTGPNGGNHETWAVPGSNVIWGGPHANDQLFHVVDVTQDANNVYIQTDWAPGVFFPGATGVSDHPAPKFNCPGCTGADPQIASLAQAPANLPLYSWQRYSFTGAIGSTAQTAFSMWGNLSQIDVNVTHAYTGGGLTFNVTQSNNWTVTKSDNTFVPYSPIVSLNTAGDRTITLSSVTGAQSGDSGLTPPDSTTTWYTGVGGAGPSISFDVSGSCPGTNCPAVTLTMQTNQGVQAPPAGLQ